MAYVTTNYKLAPGNDNAGGLTLITSLTDGTYAFAEPFGLGNLNRGQRQTLANGTISRRGFPRAQWISDMLVTQYWYLVNNYEGLVTVRLAYGGTTWANYNAVLTLPDPEEMTYTVFAASDVQAGFIGPGFRGVLWTFTRLEAL